MFRSFMISSFKPLLQTVIYRSAQNYGYFAIISVNQCLPDCHKYNIRTDDCKYNFRTDDCDRRDY